MIAFEKAEIGLPKPHGRMVKSINSAQAEGMQLASPADSVSCVRTQSNSDAPGGVERKDGIVSGRAQDCSSKVAYQPAWTSDGHGEQRPPADDGAGTAV